MVVWSLERDLEGGEDDESMVVETVVMGLRLMGKGTEVCPCEVLAFYLRGLSGDKKSKQCQLWSTYLESGRKVRVAPLKHVESTLQAIKLYVLHKASVR